MASESTSLRRIARIGVAALAILSVSLLAGSHPAFAQGKGGGGGGGGGGGKPSAPTGLIAVSGAVREVALTWNAVSGATSYRVYRGLPSDKRLPLIATRTVTDFLNTGLTANTLYQYAVTAVNSSGESAAAYVQGLALSGLPTGANPAISFLRGGTARGAYVMDADGGNVTRVGLGGRGEWSPDGSQLAYLQYSSLWVCNRDGTGSVRIVQLPPGDFWGPAWSPVPTADGNYKIAYSVGGDLWVVNPDGSGNRQLTFTSNVYPGVWEGELAWSPDATRLAVETYYEDVADPYGRDTIEVLDLGFDGVGLFEAARTTVFEDLTGNWFVMNLDWCRTGSPDVLAFDADVYDGVSSFRDDVYLLDIDNPSSLRRLLPGWTARQYSVCWSPDDTHLLFESSSTIYRVGADGSNPTAVTSGASPRWRRFP